MSWSKTLNKLDLNVKISLLKIIAQIPFFFVAMYLFNQNLILKISQNIFTDVHFWFLFSACFCLSIM